MKGDRNEKKKLFLITIVFFFLVSCGNKVRVTGIEITSLPTKLNYVEGETFDPTGLEVKKIMSDDTKIVITDYTLDKTVLSAGDTVVNVIYGDFTAPINITVEPFVRKLVDVEFKVQEGLKYTRTMNLADYVQYREVYNDGTYEAWADITSEDLVDYSIENGVLTVTASLIIKNKEWTKEFTVPVDDDYLTIDELFTKEVDGSTYLVNGILVAITSTMNRIEYILWNKDTNTFIGVNGLSGGVLFTNTPWKPTDLRLGTNYVFRSNWFAPTPKKTIPTPENYMPNSQGATFFPPQSSHAIMFTKQTKKMSL